MRYDGLRHDDINSLNMNMTEMIQQSVTSIAKQTKKQIKPRIASPTRAVMKKRRETIEHKTPRDHIDVDIMYDNKCNSTTVVLYPICTEECRIHIHGTLHGAQVKHSLVNGPLNE